jgi:hypothetical protein
LELQNLNNHYPKDFKLLLRLVAPPPERMASQDDEWKHFNQGGNEIEN